MVCAIISDVHSNLEALTAVLAAIDELAVDVIYCLGDLVGYNADPEPCLQTVLSRTRESIRGNHDKAVAGLMSLDWFNPEARQAALWTRQAMGPEAIERLKRLREGPRDIGNGILLCHGAPQDEDQYIYNASSIADSFACLAEEHAGIRVCFHGHTHSPLVASRSTASGKVKRHAVQERIELAPDAVYLVNPGSVGQPRDGINLASFGILDTEGMVYKNLRVPYAVRETQRKILKAGLPEGLARRLGEGR